MTAALYPYQEQGAAFLASRRAALLADEMGLGKSAQAIAAAFDVNPAADVLVVCPASVRVNWFREFERFWPSLVSYSLDVVSYDLVARGKFPGKAEYDVLILDEAHYLKTRTSKRTKAIFGPKCDGKGGLVERAKHVILLTGTPTPNNPSELWPALRALAPETIPAKSGKPRDYFQFVSKFCKTRNNGFGIEIVGGKNLAELRERIAPFVLRRRKEDVLKDLPPLRMEALYLDGKLELPPEVLDSVDELNDMLDREGVKGLQKMASHVATLRRLTGLAKVGPVIEWTRDWFDAGGGKLVVFAHHRDVLKALNTDKRLNHVLRCHVVGDTPAAKRQEHVDAFQSVDCPALFLGQIQAAGTGITLTAASDLLFVESSWVPAENEQAAMRIHRIGQRNACLVRFAMLAGSIDEKIQRAVMRKTADIVELFG